MSLRVKKLVFGRLCRKSRSSFTKSNSSVFRNRLVYIEKPIQWDKSASLGKACSAMLYRGKVGKRRRNILHSEVLLNECVDSAHKREIGNTRRGLLVSSGLNEPAAISEISIKDIITDGD